jgi:putative ABC transport system ATP-binding protein
VPAEPIFDLQNVSRRRERGGVVFELRVPRFQALRGEVSAIIGPSGCGKSTLLDLLAMVLKPTRAEAFRFAAPDDSEVLDAASAWEKDDQSALAQVRKRHIGYVLQSGGLLPFLTSMENILLPGWLKGQTDLKAHVREIALRLGIEPQLSKKPQFLSGGQRQRVAIARALVHDPAVVLADEPTAAVDSSRAQAIFDQFVELARERQVSMIMVTHDLRLLDKAEVKRYTFEVKAAGEDHTVSTLVEAA